MLLLVVAECVFVNLTETKYGIEVHEFLKMLKRKNPRGLSQFLVLLNKFLRMKSFRIRLRKQIGDKKTVSHFLPLEKSVEEVNEEHENEGRRDGTNKSTEILSCCFALYCTVIRLLLLTGILSMLLIAEILLSLIYGLKSYTRGWL